MVTDLWGHGCGCAILWCMVVVTSSVGSAVGSTGSHGSSDVVILVSPGSFSAVGGSVRVAVGSVSVG